MLKNNQKKMLIIIMGILLITSTLVGCNNSTPTGNSKGDKSIPLRIGTGPSGSVNYITVSGIASLLMQDYPQYNVLSEISTGSQENIRMMMEGTTQLGVSMVDSAYYAYKGEREFDGVEKESINFVMGGYPTIMHMMVANDSEIQSIADLKGKKLGVSKGTMSQYYFPILLEAYGLTPDDVEISQLQLSDICNALQDNTIDFGVHITPYPSSPISDLTTTKDIRFLEIEQDIADKIINENSYFFVGEIEGGTYKGSDNKINTLGTRNTFIANKDLEEEIVYDFVKTIIENEEKLGSIHPKASEFNKENALEGQLIPIHPGAEKYYKEIGILK